MPRYFFDVIGKSTETDDTGTDLPSDEHATQEGEKLLGALIVEGLIAKHDGATRLEVRDDFGFVILRVDVASQNPQGATMARPALIDSSRVA